MTSTAAQFDQPRAVFESALAALDTPRAESMLPAIERALRQAPSDARLLHVQGLILRQLDRRGEAIASLERATRLSPSTALIAHGLARTLFEAGLPSAEAYARALQLAPGDPAIIAGMTAALIADGEGDAAAAGLEQIIARSPLWVEGQKLLSDLHWSNGEREGFTRNFDEALAIHPTNLGLWREQIRSLVHARHWDKLLEVIASGRSAIGEHELFDVNEAICQAELGRTEAADRLFAPFEDVPDAALQVRLIRHLLRSGRAELASERISPWLSHAKARNFWPYASIAWRLTGDKRWEWLEGDDRFIGVYDIADRLPPLDTLAATLRNLHVMKGQPLEQSVRGGTQTDGNLFHRIEPAIVALREAIRSTVAEHVAGFPGPDPDHPLLGPARSPIGFSGAWSVRLQSGGRHSNHVHPMGWISSALYIALPEDLGKDQAGWLTIGEPEQLELGLAPIRLIEPKPGRLVLFPSTMWHGTRPFESGERMTVAFDVAVPE